MEGLKSDIVNLENFGNTSNYFEVYLNMTLGRNVKILTNLLLSD